MAEQRQQSYRSTGKVLEDKIRETIVLESHLIGLNKLSACDLLDYTNRASFKFALKALESYLSPYIEDECRKKLDEIRAKAEGDSHEEVDKCFEFYAALKDQLVKANLSVQPHESYETEEVD